METAFQSIPSTKHDRADLLSCRLEITAENEPRFGVTFMPGLNPVRVPANNLIFPGRNFLDLEVALGVGSRVIRMFDQEKIGAHPVVTCSARQLGNSACGQRPIERLVRVRKGQAEERGAARLQHVQKAIPGEHAHTSAAASEPIMGVGAPLERQLRARAVAK